MTWLCMLCLSMGVLLFITSGVFVVLRIVRMASDRDHAEGRHDTSEIKDLPTPRQGRRK